MESKIFESTKGQQNCQRVTICEIHRRIFDQIVIALNDQPDILDPIVKDLETAFLMGVRMNMKLLERRIESIDGFYPMSEDADRRQVLRQERIRLQANLKRQKEWYDNYVDR
jgi:hypothetical protein